MKNVTTRVFSVIALAAASALSGFAQSANGLHVHVPFAFVVGQASLPAGDYSVAQDGNSGVITLQCLNSKTPATAAVLSYSGNASRTPGTPQLVFQKVNGKTILWQIRTANKPSRVLSSF